MVEEALRLPRSSYDELTKIIKAYGQHSEPVSLTDVSRLVGIDHTVISSNARFLTGVDILESGQKKRATPKGSNLAHALEHGMEDEIRKYWRVVIEESEFLSRLVTSIRIRGGMDEATLLSHIAYSAGEQKRPSVMTGARTVVEVLRAADLISESEGKVTVRVGAPQRRGRVAPASEPSNEGSVTEGISEPTTCVVPAISTSRFGVQVNIDLRVTCRPDELDGLGEKIRDVLERITSSPDGADAEEDVGNV